MLVALPLIALSCKKQGCTDEFAVNYDVKAKVADDNFCIYTKPEVQQYVPNYGANTATLVALDRGKVENYTPFGSTYSWNYTLSAKFHGANGEYQPAGDVLVKQEIPSNSTNGFYFEELNKLLDNSYLVNVRITPPAAVTSFLDTLQWKSTGDVWPAFDIFTTVAIPNQSNISSINASIESEYSLLFNPITNADSLVLDIFGQRNHISKVISADASSYTFSAQEIESVGKGDAILRVVSVKYDIQVEGGKTYYFLNQKRSLKEVFID